jgi:hypothetical protein
LFYAWDDVTRCAKPIRTPGVLIKVATLVHASSMSDNAASLDRGGDAMPPTGWCASFVPRQNTSGKM